MRSRLLLVADLIVGAEESGPGWVLVEDGIVRSRGTGVPGGDLATTTPVHVDVIAPGLLDSHVHGAAGLDFGAIGADAAPIIELHRAAGVSAVVASLATREVGALCRRLSQLAPLVHSGELLGLHLEGPWLAPAHAGAHNRDLLRLPNNEAIDAVLDAAEGTLRMVTIAPELPGSLHAITRFVAEGVTVAIGHSAADADTANRAFDAGASVVTHLFNGMPPLSAREPGIVGTALARPEVTVELIADLVHVSASIIAIVFAAAPGRVSLVSDAMAATGLGDGSYELAGSEITVLDDVAHLADGSSLAGSTTTLGASVSGLIARGLPAASVLRAASTTPAGALNLQVPQLHPGDAANLTTVVGMKVRSMNGGVWAGC